MFAKHLGFLFAIFHFQQYNFASPPSFPYYIFFRICYQRNISFHALPLPLLRGHKSTVFPYLISSLFGIFFFSPSQFPLRVSYLFPPFLLSCHPSIISAFCSLLFHFPSLCRLFPLPFSPLSVLFPLPFLLSSLLLPYHVPSRFPIPTLSPFAIPLSAVSPLHFPPLFPLTSAPPLRFPAPHL